jgi:hypothetical protein
MSIEKIVYNALFKQNIKLNSDVVKLGLIDDLKSEMKLANQGGMKAIDMANAAKKPAEDSLKMNNSLLVRFEKILADVKTLGIDSAVKDVESQIKQVKENIKTIDAILNALYKI